MGLEVRWKTILFIHQRCEQRPGFFLDSLKNKRNKVITMVSFIPFSVSAHTETPVLGLLPLNRL